VLVRARVLSSLLCLMCPIYQYSLDYMGLGEPLSTNLAPLPPHLPLPFATMLMSEYLSFMSGVPTWNFASLVAAATASSSLDTVDDGMLMSSCSSYCDSFVLDCVTQVGNGSEGRCGGGSGGGWECGGGSRGEVGLGYSCEGFVGHVGEDGSDGFEDGSGDGDRFGGGGGGGDGVEEGEGEGEGEGDGGGGGEAVFVGEFTGW